MRGEHAAGAPPGPECWGSSPHARGAQSASHGVAHEQGIIPACAGSTISKRREHEVRRDHPRMRGEHYSFQVTVGRIVGSSPHARGAPREDPDGGHVRGIIPACAGSTPTTWPAGGSRWDHPRMRGEHRKGRLEGRAGGGSSPHARGALRREPSLGHVAGIIPACAGSTPSTQTRCSTCRDHPRMRGEHDA